MISSTIPFSDSTDNFTPGTRRFTSSGPAAALCSAAGSAVAASVLVPVGVFVAKGRKLLLATIFIDLPLQMGAHLFSSGDATELGGIASGVEISLTTMALAMLYGLWIVGYATRRELTPRVSLRTTLPLALFLGFEALSIFAARSVIYSLDELFLTAEMF